LNNGYLHQSGSNNTVHNLTRFSKLACSKFLLYTTLRADPAYYATNLGAGVKFLIHLLYGKHFQYLLLNQFHI